MPRTSRTTFRKKLDCLLLSKEEQLGLAVVEGNETEMIKLLKEGAKTDVSLEKIGQPLHYAVIHFNPRAAQILLDHGCPKNDNGDERSSPLRVWYDRINRHRIMGQWKNLQDIPSHAYQVGVILTQAGCIVSGINRGMALTGAKTDTFIEQEPFLVKLRAQVEQEARINNQVKSLEAETPQALQETGARRPRL